MSAAAVFGSSLIFLWINCIISLTRCARINPGVISLRCVVVRSEELPRLCARMFKLAEEAARSDVSERLIELSRVWMEAALLEEKHFLDEAFNA
jgi:hypothetical protein